MRVDVVTSSEDETADVGARLAASLPGGTVVLLHGDLGAGKTSFVRGMARGLGLPADDVSSPTFTLIQVYRGVPSPRPSRPPGGEGENERAQPRTLYHVDLYRIDGAEAEDLGLEELSAEQDAVMAIEWAEKLTHPFPDAVTVRIEDLGEDRRRITIGVIPTGNSAPPS